MNTDAKNQALTPEQAKALEESLENINAALAVEEKDREPGSPTSSTHTGSPMRPLPSATPKPARSGSSPMRSGRPYLNILEDYGYLRSGQFTNGNRTFTGYQVNPAVFETQEPLHNNA